MRYRLNVYDIWEYGQRKDAAGNLHQEDALFPMYGEATDNDRLFILCDGMGGHDAGEVASSTVCEAMSRSVLAAQPEPEGEFTDDMFRQALADAFDALDAKDTGAEKKMGTTMTFLKLHSQGATIAHMGDSRVYHIRPGKTAEETRILFQTKDHSLVNFLIDAGELTEEEAKHSRQKNVITRAMQPHLERRPRADIYHTADIRPGDYFYLCSDGMLENMEAPQICYNFSDATGTDKDKVERLRTATQENRDNHTAIIVHVMEVLEPTERKDVGPVKDVSASEALVGKVHDEEDDRQETSRAADRSVSKKWIGVLAVVVALVAVALAIFLWTPSDPDKGKEEPKKENAARPPKGTRTMTEESRPPVSGQEATQPVVTGEAGSASSQSIEPSMPDASVIQAATASSPDEEEGVVTSDETKVNQAIRNTTRK